MSKYVVLLRGINVGGKNTIPMAELRAHLESAGFTNVSTYIASGNVILESGMDAKGVQSTIEDLLPRKFKLDIDLIKVLALSKTQLEQVVNNMPKGFGEKPDEYHSDIIFLIDIAADEAIKVFSPREGVDAVWPGKGMIYSQRLSAERTKSRLGRIVGTPSYANMTIRSWNTTVKLLKLVS